MALQPDFAVLNQAAHQLATELTKFQNLPQIAQAQAILNAIQDLRDTLNNRVQEINDRVQETNDNIEGLERRLTRRIKASTRNEIACLQNSSRNMPVSPLIPLVHAATGNAIHGFPATVAALNTMTGPNIRAVLNALEQPETGTVAECRTRLLLAIGVIMQTV